MKENQINDNHELPRTPSSSISPNQFHEFFRGLKDPSTARESLINIFQSVQKDPDYPDISIEEFDNVLFFLSTLSESDSQYVNYSFDLIKILVGDNRKLLKPLQSNDFLALMWKFLPMNHSLCLLDFLIYLTHPPRYGTAKTRLSASHQEREMAVRKRQTLKGYRFFASFSAKDGNLPEILCRTLSDPSKISVYYDASCVLDCIAMYTPEFIPSFYPTILKTVELIPHIQNFLESSKSNQLHNDPEHICSELIRISSTYFSVGFPKFILESFPSILEFMAQIQNLSFIQSNFKEACSIRDEFFRYEQDYLLDLQFQNLISISHFLKNGGEICYDLICHPIITHIFDQVEDQKFASENPELMKFCLSFVGSILCSEATEPSDIISKRVDFLIPYLWSDNVSYLFGAIKAVSYMNANDLFHITFGPSNQNIFSRLLDISSDGISFKIQESALSSLCDIFYNSNKAESQLIIQTEFPNILLECCSNMPNIFNKIAQSISLLLCVVSNSGGNEEEILDQLSCDEEFINLLQENLPDGDLTEYDEEDPRMDILNIYVRLGYDR